MKGRALPDLDDVRSLADRLLQQTMQPIVRYRLLRDVLLKPQEDEAVQKTRSDMLQSRWVTELAIAQKDDGTWGRFHSRDTRAKTRQRIRTTEIAIERELALGLDKKCRIFQKAIHCMADVLVGDVKWPDPPEDND